MKLPNPLTAGKEPRVGRDAGWALAFHREKAGEIEEKWLLVGAASHHAEIRARLPHGAEGGLFNFVIEGLSDEQYAELKAARQERGSFLVVRLYLAWRDLDEGFLAHVGISLSGLSDLVNPNDELARAENLVAELRVTNVSRRAGSRRYETVVEARERVFDILAGERLPAPLKADPPLWAAERLTAGRGFEVTPHDGEKLPKEPPADQPKEREDLTLRSGQARLDALKDLLKAMEDASGLAGRGMALIRDGALHLGKRPIPLSEKEVPATAAGGVLEITALADVNADTGFRSERPGEEGQRRQRYNLTMLGRPDLKPGEVVKVSLPPEEKGRTAPTGVGLLGELAAEIASGDLLGGGSADPDARLYLVGIEHRLSRTSGFVTTATGLLLEPDEDGWDRPAAIGDGTPADDQGSGSPEERAARQIQRQARAAARHRRHTEVGEVRAMTEQGRDPPRQTVALWQGLAPPDGEPNQARRLALARPGHAAATGVPYLTPFAWGRCGLVLPHYFGSRVLIAHRGGEASDPLVLGAFWGEDEAPASMPGDWWLSLPVGAEGSWAAPNDEAEPEFHDGGVTHDLIDANGNRVIEVGELTIRVSRDALGKAGERPKRPGEASGAVDAVTIEHVDGKASITISKDGVITLQGTAIELDAGTEGDVTIKAKNVTVDVQQAMNVGG